MIVFWKKIKRDQVISEFELENWEYDLIISKAFNLIKINIFTLFIFIIWWNVDITYVLILLQFYFI